MTATENWCLQKIAWGPSKEAQIGLNCSSFFPQKVPKSLLKPIVEPNFEASFLPLIIYLILQGLPVPQLTLLLSNEDADF